MAFNVKKNKYNIVSVKYIIFTYGILLDKLPGCLCITHIIYIL